jgi:prophage tail gpP-like protein
LTASVLINDVVIDRWQSYSIENDMLTPADAFSLTLAPASAAVVELVPPDAEVEVRIDDTPILSGFIDERVINVVKSGPTLNITGRDRAGRLVDESADLQTFPRLDLLELADRLAKPTFRLGATLSNAENRDLVRGRRSGKAAARTEPIFKKSSGAPKKVEPGETRWDVLQQFLEPAELLAWAQANGQKLVLGLPNYDQDTQFHFLLEGTESLRIGESNIKSATITDSVANRYSKITVNGASKGSSRNYSSRVTKHTATILQGPRFDGTGASFQTRKQLIIADDDVKNESDAGVRVDREFNLREAEKLVLELTLQGHSQKLRPNDRTGALFAFDLMADVEIEEYAIAGRFLITKVAFTADKSSGRETTLTLVPEGTTLTM